MVYNPESLGLQEAVFSAIITKLQENTEGLTLALRRDGLWVGLPAISPDIVFWGDPITIPNAQLAPLWICVFGDGEIMDMEQVLISNTNYSPYLHNVRLYIRVYSQPELFGGEESVKRQSEMREKAITRISDWLRQIFNDYNGMCLSLDSNEYGNADGKDKIHTSKIANISKGIEAKGLGGTHFCHFVEATFTGQIV